MGWEVSQGGHLFESLKQMRGGEGLIQGNTVYRTWNLFLRESALRWAMKRQF